MSASKAYSKPRVSATSRPTARRKRRSRSLALRSPDRSDLSAGDEQRFTFADVVRRADRPVEREGGAKLLVRLGPPSLCGEALCCAEMGICRLGLRPHLG